MSATATALSPGPVVVGSKRHVPEVREGLVGRVELAAHLPARRARKLAFLRAPEG